jgi:hypothetical protein
MTPLEPFLAFKGRQQTRFFIASQIASSPAVSAKLPHSPARIAINQLSVEGQRENL